MAKTPVIISTDPGIDDIAALAISLFAQEFDVKMIVPTWGNVSLSHTLQNTLDLQNFLKTTVPVVAGASEPMVAPKISAASVHGSNGVGGFVFEKATSDLQVQGLAATKMYEQIMHSKSKVVLIGLGPLTDFALLFKQYPAVKEQIEKIVIMGGNIGRGNHSPLAEYNIAGDPEAAQVVFHSGLLVQVAPLEIGDKTFVTDEQLTRIRQAGQVGEMLAAMFSNIHESDGSDLIKIYDPTAIGMILQPDLFVFRPAHVEIELAGKFTYGASVIDFDNKDVNAEIAVDVDAPKFAEWFIQRISK